jgi:hypothetical protein
MPQNGLQSQFVLLRDTGQEMDYYGGITWFVSLPVCIHRLYPHNAATFRERFAPSQQCTLLFAIRHLPFAICYWQLAIGYLAPRSFMVASFCLSLAAPYAR